MRDDAEKTYPGIVQTTRRAPARTHTAVGIILAISLCHFINDMLQSLLPAVYPNLKAALGLSFAQVGLVTLVYQVTASILQPLVGAYADKHPKPFALPAGTLFTLTGLVVISTSHGYGALLAGASLLGVGSSVFHPEASRVARMAAAGGEHGLSQSIFQVGGNAGAAIGPLAAALVVIRWGRTSLACFALLALLSTVVLCNVALWYRRHGLARLDTGARRQGVAAVPRGEAALAIVILVALVFSKYVYLVSLTNFLTFYLIDRFAISVQAAQLHLFAFLASVAIGTIVGGPLGDRFGRKYVIWFSIVGTLPFALLLPHANLFWTLPLTMTIGVILASAFPAIVVFAQELVPGQVGMISGLFFGFAFGIAGLGAALLGWLADADGIDAVYRVCAYLPLVGLLAALLPNIATPLRPADPSASSNAL
jgi:FSR family fosmidomycin resistance protein-like MFS transporter